MNDNVTNANDSDLSLLERLREESVANALVGSLNGVVDGPTCRPDWLSNPRLFGNDLNSSSTPTSLTRQTEQLRLQQLLGVNPLNSTIPRIPSTLAPRPPYYPPFSQNLLLSQLTGSAPRQSVNLSSLIPTASARSMSQTSAPSCSPPFFIDRRRPSGSSTFQYPVPSFPDNATAAAAIEAQTQAVYRQLLDVDWFSNPSYAAKLFSLPGLDRESVIGVAGSNPVLMRENSTAGLPFGSDVTAKHPSNHLNHIESLSNRLPGSNSLFNQPSSSVSFDSRLIPTAPLATINEAEQCLFKPPSSSEATHSFGPRPSSKNDYNKTSTSNNAQDTANVTPTSELHYPQHFVKGSIIQLSNGELRRVETLNTEDFVKSAQDSPELKLDTSTVIKIQDPTTAYASKKRTVLLEFSVGHRGFKVAVEATQEHPFFVFGRGWSSYNPKSTLARFGLDCHDLKVGDVCVSLTHKDAYDYVETLANKKIDNVKMEASFKSSRNSELEETSQGLDRNNNNNKVVSPRSPLKRKRSVSDCGLFAKHPKPTLARSGSH